MLTYQVRKRVLRVDEGGVIVLPAQASIRLHFLPQQPFGTDQDGGRTTVRAKAATAQFNANSGNHSITCSEPLEPLRVEIQEPGRNVVMDGRTLHVTQVVNTPDALDELLGSLYFGFPWLLNVLFVDPPYVERVEGEVGGVPFRWELEQWALRFETTTQDQQESRIARAWTWFDVVSGPGRRRLVAALHYLHVARRLSREGETAGEFMAEVLLNLAKVLEVLFPGANSLDAAREGLTELGYSGAGREARFIPVLALRNQIDVGHVHLSVMTRSQLSVLHAFLEQAESNFRQLLLRVIESIQAGEWDVPAYTDLAPRPAAVRTIERMAEAMNRLADEQ